MDGNTEKQCNNECGIGWCCSSEFFVDRMGRITKEALELYRMKGIQVKLFPSGHQARFTAVAVRVPVTCCNISDSGCILKDLKPRMCKVYPDDSYRDWFLHKDCPFFDPEKHWDYDNLIDYEPEV